MCSQQEYSKINIHTLLLKKILVFLCKQVHYELFLTVPCRRKSTNLCHGIGKQKFKACSCAVSIVEYKILCEKICSLL